jgi:hypothetical protein
MKIWSPSDRSILPTDAESETSDMYAGDFTSFFAGVLKTIFLN